MLAPCSAPLQLLAQPTPCVVQFLSGECVVCSCNAMVLQLVNYLCGMPAPLQRNCSAANRSGDQMSYLEQSEQGGSP